MYTLSILRETTADSVSTVVACAEYRVYKVTHPRPAHAAGQEQEINFVQPKISPGRRRGPLIQGPDEGGSTSTIDWSMRSF